MFGRRIADKDTGSFIEGLVGQYDKWREPALPFDTVLRSLHWVLDQIASVLRESTAGYLLRGLGFVSWDSFPIHISWEGETWWQEMWWMVICLESPG